MNFLRQIVSMIAVMLFTALGVGAMPFLLNASHQVEFFPHREAAVAGQTGVHFAARGPPLASTDVAFTGAAVTEPGDGFVVHGHEIHLASLGFGADFDATKGGVTNGLPENDSQLGHIFRADHNLPNTPANRQLLLDTTNNPANLSGTDRFGNDVYIFTQPDGSQIWGYTRNGTIQNGGINNPPKVWVPGHGL